MDFLTEFGVFVDLQYNLLDSRGQKVRYADIQDVKRKTMNEAGGAEEGGGLKILHPLICVHSASTS